MWRLRIEQYFQIQDYTPWDVIENGNSFKLVAQTIEDLEQIHKDDLKEIKLKWQLALLSIRAKRVPRNQENRTRNQETTRRTVNMEDTSSKAMVEIDGAAILKSKLEEISKEKNDIENKIKKFENAPQCLDKLIKIQITNKSKRDLGYVSYNAILPPHIGRFSPLRFEFSHSGLPEFAEPSVESYEVKTTEVVTQTSSVKISEPVKENNGAPLIKDWESEREDEEIYPTSLTSRSLMKGILHLGEELKVNKVLVVKLDFKTPYELFKGRTHALSFMRPFGCHVTILNTLDHLGKFDGKFDEGFFVGYSTNSKAFRIYNTGTRKVEKNLHINFLENKPTIACDGPKWLFNIDALIESMNYAPVITGTNSIDFAGKEASFDKGQSSIETGPCQDYILIPLWNDGSLFDSSSKDSDGDNKDNDGPCKESKIDNQEMPNAKKSTKICLDGVEVDISNISTTYPVYTTPNIRIHKDCSLDNVIGDMQSVDLPRGKRSIGTKWVFRNKKDKRGIVIRNKSRLVAQGFTLEEGTDYDEVFALVERIKAIRLFLAYVSFMGFLVYQMDDKSAFLYGRIEDEVYVCQPPGFKDPDYPDKVYKVEKALYGLHQASKACQDKYVDEILRKFKYADVKPASTPMDKEKPLLNDLDGDDVDVHLYRSMIRLTFVGEAEQIWLSLILDKKMIKYELSTGFKQGKVYETAGHRIKSNDTEVVDFSTASPKKDADEITLADIKKSAAKDNSKAIMQETMESIRKFVPMESKCQIAYSKAGEGSLKEGESLKRPAEEELGHDSKRNKRRSTLKRRFGEIIEFGQGKDICMLVAKEYLLSRGSLLTMLVQKLQVDEHNEMAEELLRKIFMQEKRPRK
nr:putative ribonuclease H-like domain-containing protein [Tanacetum cinerariifolium]